jgi:mRNA-degrading endonuclease RelE of RelBE toxin-antitoxin system
MAEVILAANARRELDELDRGIHHRVIGILARLGHWPEVSGAKSLRHGLAGRYRIRTGDYRVQFRVIGHLVIVEKIGHRDGFYEDD